MVYDLFFKSGHTVMLLRFYNPVKINNGLLINIQPTIKTATIIVSSNMNMITETLKNKWDNFVSREFRKIIFVIKFETKIDNITRYWHAKNTAPEQKKSNKNLIFEYMF